MKKHKKDNPGKKLTIAGHYRLRYDSSRQKQKKVDWDYDYASMRRSSRTAGYREPKDYLNPLFNYLHSMVGQNWNTVYSNLLKSCTRRLDRHHMKQHIRGYIIFPGEPFRYFYARRKQLYIDDSWILRVHDPSRR